MTDKNSSNTKSLDTRDLQRLLSTAHHSIHDTHRRMISESTEPDVRAAALEAMREVLALLQWCKWHLGSRTGTHADFAAVDPTVQLEDLREALVRVKDQSDAIAEAIASGSEVPKLEQIIRQKEGTEIQIADGVPLVPGVEPVVILRGSNFEMGRQYAEQVIDIYGPWIFERLAAREVSAADLEELEKWTAQLRSHAPEIIEFAEGWSAGSIEAGVPLTREHTIAIWTGWEAPATEHLHMGAGLPTRPEDGVRAYLGSTKQEIEDELREMSDLCSGAVAWGETTGAQRLAAGSTTDHDCTYQATIIAFPEKGNNFIYTPFSVNGSIPVLGRFYMAGHPGVNDKGLTYVHHGGQAIDGGSAGGGPREQWGHGLRRGAATMHALQFSNTAAEARDYMLSLPVGDAGRILGTAGGLWADTTYGVAIEERAGCPQAPKPLMREKTVMDGVEQSLLYANNNPLHPDPGSWQAIVEGEFRFEADAGWFITKAAESGTEDPATNAARMSTKNSAARNRFFHREMKSRLGKLDADGMEEIYRTSGTIPEGDPDEVVERWREGEQWNSSAAHRGNAFTAVVGVDKAKNEIIYRACVGPSERFLQIREPSHGYYYAEETNAFWEMSLAEDENSMLQEAVERATALLNEAEAAAANAVGPASSRRSQRILQDAQQAFARATSTDAEPEQSSRTSSRILRDLLRAQVFAVHAAQAARAES